MGLLVIVARGVGHCGRVVTGPYRDRVGGVVCNCDAHEGRREQGREHQAAGRQHDTASIGAACPSGSLQNEHARPKRREKMWEASIRLDRCFCPSGSLQNDHGRPKRRKVTKFFFNPPTIKNLTQSILHGTLP
jgi:hypothetical protein